MTRGPKRIKAVLFDMDGTLVDSEPLHFTAMEQALAAAGVVAPEGFGERVTGKSAAECFALLVTETGTRMRIEDFLAGKQHHYLRGAASLRLRPGAADALSAVVAAGAGFAIVSNSDRMVADANLGAVGLSVPGLVTVTRNDVRQGKPHPEPYLRAAYLLGVEPAECLVVEDSAPGAVAGLAAGMAVIAWPEPHRADIRFPDGVIACPPEALAPLLSAHLRRPTAARPQSVTTPA